MDLRTAMHRAVDTLEPPTERLVAGAIVRGRRHRMRRRTAEAGSAAVVLGAAAAIAVALLPGGAHLRAATQAAGSGSGSGSGPATSYAVPPPPVPMTPQALLQTALDSLPRPGTTSHYAGNSAIGLLGTQFVYDDGHGAALISVDMNYPPAGAGLGDACQISVCRTLADGAKIAVYQGNGHPGDPSIPGKDWQVTVLRTNGVAVSVTEWNSMQEKGGPQTRPLPPFTVDELEQWVGSGAFTTQVGASYAAAAAHLFTPTHSG